MRVVGPVLAAAAVAWILLGASAHAEPERGTARLDHAGVQGLLASLGYQPREARNESGPEYEIVLRPPGGRAVTTRVTLSKDGTLVWLVAWLKKVPPGRTINGNAILDMLTVNDAHRPQPLLLQREPALVLPQQARAESGPDRGQPAGRAAAARSDSRADRGALGLRALEVTPQGRGAGRSERPIR